ncbi:hypothetical protein FB45DRAFT_1109412 [Roridomyces roridus]|uniref:Uncharacterized protein n=1 Tax=Roridomyces roridus TaxID=1738132 RepID=A0AAD7FC37_9AGAR|nr:hypothetical protein FB45DRAFT_1109412 [Roridomyces roridus]
MLLSSPLRKFLTSQQRPLEPHTLLPIELWYTILDGLSDHGLLGAAGIYKVRNKIPSLRTDAAEMPTTLHLHARLLPALHISCAPLPAAITQLSVQFQTFAILRHLEGLRDIVHSASLEVLEMDFAGSLLDAWKWDTRVPSPLRNQASMLQALCRVLSAVAAKRPAGLVVLAGGKFFSGHSDDIIHWGLEIIVSGTVQSPIPPSIYSASISLRPELYTLIIFNLRSITSFSLMDVPLQPAELTALLRTVEFPDLQFVVFPDAIDAVALREFLFRHPGLQGVEYRGTKAGIVAGESYARLNLFSQRDHFQLSYRRASCSLPALHPIFALSLHLIMQHSHGDAYLSLHVSDLALECAVDDELKALLKTMHCITALSVTCRSVEVGFRALAWIVYLPELRCLDFDFQERTCNRRSMLGAFEKQVKARLPDVEYQSQEIINDKFWMSGFSRTSGKSGGRVLEFVLGSEQHGDHGVGDPNAD